MIEKLDKPEVNLDDQNWLIDKINELIEAVNKLESIVNNSIDPGMTLARLFPPRPDDKAL